jgi:hypothetical protein
LKRRKKSKPLNCHLQSFNFGIFKKFNVFSTLLFLFFLLLQVIFILEISKKESGKLISQYRANSTCLNYICNQFESYYLMEEVVYLLIALSFLLLTSLISTNNNGTHILPFNSFSTSFRLITAVIYGTFTFDILTSLIYFILGQFDHNDDDSNGVLVHLLIQIIQIVLIGFKFYPLLIIINKLMNRNKSDLETEKKSIVLSILAFIYAIFIYSLKILNGKICRKVIVSKLIKKFCDNFLKIIDNKSSGLNISLFI